jgi:hypothetical protein
MLIPVRLQCAHHSSCNKLISPMLSNSPACYWVRPGNPTRIPMQPGNLSGNLWRGTVRVGIAVGPDQGTRLGTPADAELAPTTLKLHEASLQQGHH